MKLVCQPERRAIIRPAPHRLGWLLAAATICVACGNGQGERVLTIAGSAVGREADALHVQLNRFQQLHPEPRVEMRSTPDAADHRHQLYVQWLNARAPEPDVLQIDVVWTAEFAAAGWILDLDRFRPGADDFFEAAIRANRWRGRLYALPWFVDVGMLYRRTDLVPEAPADSTQLTRLAAAAQRAHGVPYGLVWPGARYEGLVTVFLEYLTAAGGSILDDQGAVAVDSDAAVRALSSMRDAIYVNRTVPPAVLTWQEEPVRFAFQNGQAVFMRNWPYAYGLLQDPSASGVAGRVAVSAMPPGPGGTPAAALGGSQLAINAHSDDPEAAYRLIAWLLEPAQLLERARLVGQFPPRPSMYDGQALAGALRIPADSARAIIERAVPRPVTPVYSEISEILQIALHRALTRQDDPRSALAGAAAAMRATLAKAGLAASAS